MKLQTKLINELNKIHLNPLLLVYCLCVCYTRKANPIHLILIHRNTMAKFIVKIIDIPELNIELHCRLNLTYNKLIDQLT